MISSKNTPWKFAIWMCSVVVWYSTKYLSFSTNLLARIYKLVVTDLGFRVVMGDAREDALDSKSSAH